MTDTSHIAYCGLYCGDCIIRCGRLADKARLMLKQMQKPEFLKIAGGLRKKEPDTFGALKDYETAVRVLESMLDLDCYSLCKTGGGSSDCKIRDCCKKKNIEGCWQCDSFETCETLAWIEPVHCGAHIKNITIIRDKGVEGFLEGEKWW